MNLQTESGESSTEGEVSEEDSSNTTNESDKNTAIKQIINDAMARLPSNFNVEKTREKLPDAYADSLGTTLCQEMSRYNKLLLNIRRSLHEIEAALAGRAAFSAESEASKKAIERNAVRKPGKKVSYPSLKPFSSYFLTTCWSDVTCSTLGIETENHPLCFGYLVSSSRSRS